LIGRALYKPGGSTTIDLSTHSGNSGGSYTGRPSESLWKKMIGKLYSGKPTFRFDEGVLEIEPLGYYASSLIYWSLRFHRLGDLEKVANGFIVYSFL
jgi:hypothetical protein